MKAFARVTEKYMNDNDLLMKAIDSYELYTSSEKAVLKTLIKLSSSDDMAIISVLNLSNISNVSRPIVYKALNILEEHKVIERVNRYKGRLSCFTVKQNKLNEIIKHYNLRENILHEMKK